MDAERLRTYLLKLPHVAETMQWGANLVFWVGDKTIGGKMFALINLDDSEPLGAPSMRSHRMGGFEDLSARRLRPVLSYAAGPTRYPDLLEREGLIPAPYLARAHWIAALHWDAFTPAEWKAELLAAHALILAKLPPKTRKLLAAPPAPKKPST